MLFLVDSTLERGEKITLLEDKAERMTSQARQFKKTAGMVSNEFILMNLSIYPCNSFDFIMFTKFTLL